MAKHRLDIERNAEGHKLAYLAPIDENNSISGGFRIAGPKAWGGSANLATINLKTDDLVEYIKRYAPDVMKALEKEK